MQRVVGAEQLTGNGDDDVERAKHQPFHVVRLAVHDEQVDEDNADEEGDGLDNT